MAPPPAQDHSPLAFGQIRKLKGGGGGGVPSSLAKSEYWGGGGGGGGGVPLRLAKSGADPGFRCGGKVMAWRDTPTPASGVWGGAPAALQLSHFLSHKT